ncbi:MAG: YbdK family carboxylate-amine ligase [Solirubrobacterales bacterium]|nr:YbdK family carboxylate-amine ligase [Solirubrobacterales bacterium]
MLDHNFNHSRFTVGIEEELMLLDPETLDLTDGIESILPDVPPDRAEYVKPELFQSVLEVATSPCTTVTEAAEELGAMRRLVCDIAASNGMLVGAAGTHPFALCDDQSIVERERYVDLMADLGFIASRELIFGTHVHVGIDDPERAIYVADGIRRHLPLLLALSSNSPYWEGRRTNLHSSRTPVFRAFPRVGIPPHYGSWEIYSARIEQMVRSGAIDDYTYLWWDVRPHPRLGTVEVRIFDQATRLEDTAAYAALTVSLAHRYAMLFDAGEPLVEQLWELVDDNKVRACIRGMEGELVDFRLERHVPAVEMAERLLREIAPSAAELGCTAELGRVHEILATGTGSRRQIDWVESRGGEDLRGLVEAVVALTAPEPA